MKPVLTLDLSPRPNVHVEPSCARDVGEIVGWGLCALAWVVVLYLVML